MKTKRKRKTLRSNKEITGKVDELMERRRAMLAELHEHKVRVKQLQLDVAGVEGAIQLAQWAQEPSGKAAGHKKGAIENGH